MCDAAAAALAQIIIDDLTVGVAALGCNDCSMRSSGPPTDAVCPRGTVLF